MNKNEMSGRMHHAGTDLLVRIACADAYAAAAEFLDDRKSDESMLLSVLESLSSEVGYRAHPRPGHAQVGQYTDDTEMTVANARVLLGEYPCTPEGFASAYVDEHAFGGYRSGYARGLQEFMRAVGDGAAFMRTIRRSTSCKNGSVMRAGIIGVLPDLQQVMAVATDQASVTHYTPCGILSARIAAVATWYALHTNVSLVDVPGALRTHQDQLLAMPEGIECAHMMRLADQWWRPWDGSPVVRLDDQSIAITTIRAALTLAATQPTFVEVVRGAIRYRGDTDSVAAVAAAITAPRHREVLPEFFERDLELGSPRTGTVRLRALGTALMSRFGGL